MGCSDADGDGKLDPLEKHMAKYDLNGVRRKCNECSLLRSLLLSLCVLRGAAFGATVDAAAAAHC